MKATKLHDDPKWTRANTLFPISGTGKDVALLGVPAKESAITPTSAHLTPSAIRSALSRYSTYSSSHEIDLREMDLVDLGDVQSPDAEEGEARLAQTVADARSKHKLLIALGGDNSITYSIAAGLWPDLSKTGLITLDAHLDIRDGRTNGSPVWRLIQAGMRGQNIVQIGISDFANSREYFERTKEAGIHVITRDQLRKRPISDFMKEALEIAGKGDREIYVDLDVDVCDRAVAPACPGSVPGGITADELRQVAFLAGSDRRVRALDITEIDPSKDAPDERTVRLGALLVLEATSGVPKRITRSKVSLIRPSWQR